MSINAKPNALILFNPAVVRAPVPGLWQPTAEELSKFEAWFGEDAHSFSPFHHITKGIGPTIIINGTADSTVTYKSVKLFCDKMREQGNRCEVVGYSGAKHAFFNFGRGENAAFIDTVNKMDQFLVSLGYLSAPPEAESY